MPTHGLSSVLHHLLRRMAPSSDGEVSDTELLNRFARHRDEAAFELLIWRHGPMVLGLCQRMLHQPQDAEDAFQATFLVLVRKARSIGKGEALASWLYKVAYRIACRARPRAAALSNQPNAMMEGLPATETGQDAIWRDLRVSLDHEVARLPEAYRRPIILCYLEGKTQEEAGRLLGWPKGTVATRLARGRERLRVRLERRGWTLTSAVLAAVLASRASAGAIAPELVRATLRGALAYAAGSVGAILSTNTVALTEGALRIMWYSQLKMMGGVLLASLLAVTGVGLVVRHAWAGAGPEDPQAFPVDARAGEPKPDFEKLTREVAKLRIDLEAALKEIKDLKDASRQANSSAEPSPVYRGKPVRFWLDQVNDGDPKYRVEAVTALGTLAHQRKALIPVLVAALKDNDDSVQIAASNALGKLGPEVVPALLEVLKDKTAATAHSPAIDALTKIGPEAKAAVPLLIRILQSDDFRDWYSSIAALESIGPSAKPAIPALVGALGRMLEQFKEKNYRPDRGTMPVRIVNALVTIDRDIQGVVPRTWVSESGSPVTQANTAELFSQFQKLHDELKKKYPPMEK